MHKSTTRQFSFNGKSLTLFCASLNGQDIPYWISEYAEDAFERLAPYIINNEQVLYVRDIPFLTIDGKYPGGNCYNSYEALVALWDWHTEKQQVKAAFNHELHHLARWQNSGYGETVGGAILSEGLATFYEELMSGWSPPWSKGNIPKRALEAAEKEWDDKDYNHEDWFYQGPYGKWVGYGIGYKLAQKIFAEGFDLAKSINIKPEEVRRSLLLDMV